MYKFICLIICIGSVHATELTDVRHSYSPGKTRLVLDFSSSVEVFFDKNGQDAVFFIDGITTPYTALPNIPQVISSGMGWQQKELTLNFTLNSDSSIKYFELNEPSRLVVDFYGTEVESLSTQIATETVTEVATSADEIVVETEVTVTSTIEDESETILAELTRDSARLALSMRIKELTDAVLEQRIQPSEARQLLITYRETLSDALAGREVDMKMLRLALGLTPVQANNQPLIENAIEVVLVKEDEQPYISSDEFNDSNADKEAALAAVVDIGKEDIQDVEISVAEANLTPVENDVLFEHAEEHTGVFLETALNGVQFEFETINGIRRPILDNEMTIDFTDPLNPFELLIEAEKQLLIADFAAQQAQVK